jgi:integrase
MVMNAYPFSIFKRADRTCYSVSFKDENGKYLSPVSTGKKNEQEAIKVAFQMLRDGIPQKKKSVTVRELSLKDDAKRFKTKEEAEIILTELQRLGLVKSYVLDKTQKAELFNSFLLTYWDWDISPYIQEKLRQAHSIHKRHCRQQYNAIKLYWVSFFEGRYLGDITYDDISRFINHLAKEPISGSRKNIVIKAGTQALRYAFARRWIDTDPTMGHLLFSTKKNKRNILTPAIAGAAFMAEWSFERAKMANMLASITGMRSGEIMALKYQDIGTDCLFVQNSWNYVDKLKTTKNNETRKVEIAFPFVIKKLVELAQSNPWGISPDSYVFWSDFHADKPMEGYFFLDGFREALTKIGFSKDEALNYDFHGWRHFFTSYMVGRLNNKLLKSQTGHKTDDMILLYSDHEIVGDREIIQANQREVFAGMIPAPVLMIEYQENEQTIAA